MKKYIKSISKIVLNILIAMVFSLPFYWTMLTSIKTLGQSVQIPPEFWVKQPQWENFVSAFERIPFMHMLANSLIVTVSIIICQIITVIPAAYAFSRFEFKGKNILFGITLATMMIPAQLVFLPVFLFLSEMKMINHFASLILPSACSAFAIFMLRQSFKQIPEELLEAARLDNANEWKIVTRIMLPIARPTIITLGLLTFINTWNDYFWPMALTTNDDVRTLPVGIASLRMAESGAHYPLVMAGSILLLVPVVAVFLLAQKQIIKAFTYMGEK